MQISVRQGVRTTKVLSDETRGVRDVEPDLQELEPSAGPLTTIMSRLETGVVTNQKAEWFEDQLLPDFDTLGAQLLVGDVSMTVGNYQLFRNGDLVRINDNEVVRVNATPAANPVSITRGFGSVPATAAPNGARLMIVSDAAQEFDTYRDQLTTVKQEKYNYVQHIASSSSWSNQDIATTQYAGQDIDNEHRKMIVEQKKKMEKALILGQPFLDTASASTPIGAMGGMLYYISQNVKDVSGGFTEAELEDFMRICFRYGSDKKLLFCSPKAIQSINGFARAKLQTYCNDDTYGVTITEYKSAGRYVGLVEEKLLTNQSLNDLTGIAGYAILIDPMNVKMSYMKGLSTQLHENLQNPGQTGRVDEVRGDATFKMFLDQTHGLITGIND